MAKFEMPKINLTDKQKKIAKALAIALGAVLIFIIVGIFLQKKAPAGVSGTGDSSAVVQPDGTAQIPGPAESSGGVFGALRNLLSGKGSVVTGDLATGPTPGVNPDGTPVVTGSNLAPELQQQFIDAANQAQHNQQEIDRLRAQLAAAQHQLEVYQQTLQNGGQQITPANQAVLDGMNQQIETFQAQLDMVLVNSTFASLQMIYYFCYGQQTDPGLAPITLDDIADGQVSIVDANGNFNVALCGSLNTFIEQIPAWLQSEGFDPAAENIVPILDNFVQMVSFVYCQDNGTNPLCNGFTALGDNFTQYNGLYNPAINNFVLSNNLNFAGDNFVISNAFTQVPWQDEQQQLDITIEQLNISLFVYIEINLGPLLGGVPSIDQLAARNMIELYLDSEQSYWQDGTLRLQGIVDTGGLPVQNLRLVLRYGVPTPGNIQQITQTNALFDSITPFTSVPISFIIPSPTPGQMQYVPMIPLLPPDSLVDFFVQIDGLNQNVPWMFDIIDPDFNITIN